jgi:succinate-semialdehyde dehydrogenase/glutarate-semialdehyde dehydrogenase
MQGLPVALLDRPELLRSEAFVGGNWVGEPEIPVLDPASGAIVGHVPSLGAEIAREAIRAAKTSFKDWSKRSAFERSELLKRWFGLLRRHREDLARILTSEQGKPLAEARAEIDYAARYVEFYAEEAIRIYGEVIPSPFPDGRIVVIRQPVGVVAAITPWNFPAAMVTRKLAPALATGCTTVLKPALETPLTALALAFLAEEAGLPPGTINVVTGDAAPIGEVFCKSTEVRALTFTGSTAVGRQLMAACAGTVKRLGLELGGDAPFIVFADADIDAAVEGAVQSKFRNSGQTCVCANRFLVHDSLHDVFIERLAARVEKMILGCGADEDSDIGPLITDGAADRVRRLIQDAVDKGGRILPPSARGNGRYIAPIVIGNATPDMAVLREEIFGPVAPVVRFTSEAEAIALANASDYGLAAYFYSKDHARIWRVAEALECGMVAVNSGVLSTEVAPFGGVKQSGLGREGSRHGLDEFIELKYVMVGGLG